MKQTELKEHNGIVVGDLVIYIPENGFSAGHRQRKRIAGILCTKWTEEEAMNMSVPMTEILYKFTDGTIAGSFDSVYKERI